MRDGAGHEGSAAEAVLVSERVLGAHNVHDDLASPGGHGLSYAHLPEDWIRRVSRMAEFRGD